MKMLKDCNLVGERRGKLTIKKDNWVAFITRMNLNGLVEVEPKDVNRQRQYFLWIGPKLHGYHPDVLAQLPSLKLGFYGRQVGVAGFAIYNVILPQNWE